MSGAANCPETPRQKMIGMMYLMLTAELALNVSREVLDSFVLVNDSLTTTTEIFSKKNEKIYTRFEQADAENHVKVGKWREKALEVKVKADSLYDFIQDTKLKIVRKEEGKDAIAITGRKIDAEKIHNKDDMNVPSQIMVGSTGIGEGTVLKKMIIKYRQYLASFVSAKDTSVLRSINQNLNTADPKTHEAGREGEHVTWEEYHFDNLPLVAVLTILSKLQSDVRNTQADVVNYLYSQIDASSFKFNKLSGTIIPNSNYIFKGANYEAQVFLAAFDTTRKPVIMVGDYDSTKTGYKMLGDYDTIPIVNGMGVYNVKTQKEGYQKWGGLIQYSVPGGGIQNYPFKGEYRVAKPNLVVSPTKMNVFYYGINNPVDISVSGVASDKIHPTASNATIRKERKGGYVVQPTTTGGIVKIRVAADINGERKPMGVKEFRIRLIPTPIAKVMNKTSGPISKTMLLSAYGVNAELEDFVFDLRFIVKSFTVTATIAGYTKSKKQSGNKFSSEQNRIIKSLKSGDRLTIEDIKAAGPDGRLKKLSPLVFKIK